MGEAFNAKFAHGVRNLEEHDSTGLVKSLNSVRRESKLRLGGGVPVNDFLWYDLPEKYPGELGIHLQAVGTKFSERKAAITLYKQGLDMLADRLSAHDPEFAAVTQISGWSKVVYQNQPFLRRMGFEIAEIDEENKEALAVMVREKFITRPWRKLEENAE